MLIRCPACQQADQCSWEETRHEAAAFWSGGPGEEPGLLDGKQQIHDLSSIFPIAHLIAYRFMILEAGDLITTGTPSGVDPGMKPERYLRKG